MSWACEPTNWKEMEEGKKVKGRTENNIGFFVYLFAFSRQERTGKEVGGFWLGFRLKVWIGDSG